MLPVELRPEQATLPQVRLPSAARCPAGIATLRCPRAPQRLVVGGQEFLHQVRVIHQVYQRWFDRRGSHVPAGRRFLHQADGVPEQATALSRAVPGPPRQLTAVNDRLWRLAGGIRWVGIGRHYPSLASLEPAP